VSTRFNLNNRQKRILSLSLLLAAGFYLSYAVLAGYDNLLAALSSLGISGVLFLLLCSTGNYLLRFIRWQYFIKIQGHIIPGWLHLNYYMAGFALTTTPAKAGETIRSLYLKSHGINISHSLASFFCERLLDVIVVTLIALLVILNFDQYQYYVLVASAVLIMMLPLLKSKQLLKLIHYLAARAPFLFLQRIFQYAGTLLKQAHNLLLPKPLYSGLMIGLLAWSLQGIAFYYLLTVLDTSPVLATAMAIYAISLLAGALSFIPGGIGATEAVMYLLLTQVGVDSTTALIIPLINRISTLWYAVLLGLLSSLYLGFIADDTAEKNNIPPTST
jgi:uncharacterized protein (TIRG00374 family)